MTTQLKKWMERIDWVKILNKWCPSKTWYVSSSFLFWMNRVNGIWLIFTIVFCWPNMYTHDKMSRKRIWLTPFNNNRILKPFEKKQICSFSMNGYQWNLKEWNWLPEPQGLVRRVKLRVYNKLQKISPAKKLFLLSIEACSISDWITNILFLKIFLFFICQIKKFTRFFYNHVHQSLGNAMINHLNNLKPSKRA